MGILHQYSCGIHVEFNTEAQGHIGQEICISVLILVFGDFFSFCTRFALSLMSASKVLPFWKENKNFAICFAFLSLIRTFAPK